MILFSICTSGLLRPELPRSSLFVVLNVYRVNFSCVSSQQPSHMDFVSPSNFRESWRVGRDGDVWLLNLRSSDASCAQQVVSCDTKQLGCSFYLALTGSVNSSRARLFPEPLALFCPVWNCIWLRYHRSRYYPLGSLEVRIFSISDKFSGKYFSLWYFRIIL